MVLGKSHHLDIFLFKPHKYYKTFYSEVDNMSITSEQYLSQLNIAVFKCN